MSKSRFTVVAVAVLAAVSGLLADPARAVGPGTFTAITLPATDVHLSLAGVDATLTVAGIASPDVSTVDIACTYTASGVINELTLLAGVTVTAGAFSTTVTVSNPPPCRLRALPVGVTVGTDYLGAYSGPILRANRIDTTAGVLNEYDDTAEPGDGYARLRSAGSCGVRDFRTVTTPTMAQSPSPLGCALSLSAARVDGDTSGVVVDGHPSYLPTAVANYLIGNRGLAVTPTAITLNHSAAPDGTVLTVETAELERCSGADTYPPTGASCPSLLPTGVTFKRTVRFGGDGHQIVVQDGFVADNAAPHSVSLEYGASVAQPPAGEPGINIPNHSVGFEPVTTQTVSAFGNGAGTMLIRSDRFARPDSEDADTLALTWSRPPGAVAVRSTSGQIGLRYTLGVPGQGTALLRFVLSEDAFTAGAQARATAAVAGMVAAPVVTAPRPSALIGSQTTIVAGQVSAGANGLPASVRVNGRAATLVPVSDTTATFSLRLALPWGRHPIVVTARDDVGNTASATVVVTNTPALVAGRPGLRGAVLLVPVTCQRFGPRVCVGRIVVRSVRGKVLGQSAAFTVARGRGRTIAITLHGASGLARVNLHQREPTGAYVLASVKIVRV